MSMEIDILAIFASIWKKKYIIVLACVIGALAMYLRATYLTTPTYTASVMMYANNSIDTEGSTSISSGDMTASAKVVKACEAIIKSDPVLEQVRIDLDYPPISGVSVYSINETQVFQIDVSAPNPENAVKFANRISEVAPEKIADEKAKLAKYEATYEEVLKHLEELKK